MSGTGIGGMRNEYLITLGYNFNDTRALKAINAHEAMAARFLNAELPAWYYYLNSGIRLSMSIGIQTHLDTHHEHCCIELDCKNAFGEMERAVMLEAVCKSKSTWRDLGPVTWATFSPCCTGFFIRFFNEYGGFSIIKGTEGNCNP